MFWRLKWPLIGLGIVVVLGLPKIAADANLGPWLFTVTAERAGGFREVYSFRTRRACEAERAAMRRDFARVVADHGAGTAVGRLARRVRIGPCEAVRRVR